MPNSRHCSLDLFNKSTPNTGTGEYVFYVRVEKLHYGIHPSTSATATLGQRQFETAMQCRGYLAT